MDAITNIRSDTIKFNEKKDVNFLNKEKSERKIFIGSFDKRVRGEIILKNEIKRK